MTVEAAALPAGQEAAVTKTIRAGKVHLAFGLPRGEQGVSGPEGKQGQRGPKGDPGTGLKILGYYDTLPALEAAAAAVCAMGLCGEIANKRMTELDGNSSYRNYIIDAMYRLTPAALEKGAKYEMR